MGRGPWKSYCILLAGSSSEDAERRIAAMTGTNDGFKIAEVDLELRGPGDFFGTRQAGLPTFRLVDLVRDRELLATAHREAEQWIAKSTPSGPALEKLLTSWEERFKLIQVG